MKEIQKFIKLNPIPKPEKRPLWSVLIPTYNCASYLKETLISVLDQDQGAERMEIIVVDDHSTQDDPEKTVQDFGKGRVKFIRQSQNVGKVRNYESGLHASKGHLIHQLHGDDKVRPGFYKSMEDTFSKFPNISAAFCRSIYIDEKGVWKQLTGIEQYNTGILDDVFERLIHSQIIQTPSMVVKRKVYETIGTFHRGFDCMEDWEMWLRIAYHYPIAFINNVLAEYRIHGLSTSSAAFQTGNFMKEHREITKIIKDLYGSKINIKLVNSRNKEHAKYLLNNLKAIRGNNSIRHQMLIRILFLSKNPVLLAKAINYCFF